MAQADSVPISSRQLITGESANQSTSLPAVRVKPIGRRHFIDRSDARVITGTSEAPSLRLWRENRGDVEPEALSNGCWYGVGTGQVPFGPSIGALFYATVVFLLGCLPRSILLILLRFLSRNKRLRFGALDKVCHRTSWSNRGRRRG
jgi:hypothetical protein